MRHILTNKLIILIGLMLLPLLGWGQQAGDLDISFQTGTGANDMIRTAALQADGKIIIGGWFTSYNGTTRNYVARLNADGRLDATFNPSNGANGWIYTIAVQADGKIIIGGDFTSFNGISRNRIARLNADGSLDTTFNPSNGANGSVYTTAIQSDGKVIIGGVFTFYNGTSRNYIARLNTNGSLDVTFNHGAGANLWVRTAIVQTDDKIIIGGAFSSYNDTSRNYIARLNADGSLDASFNPGTGADGWVRSSPIQTDGKIIISGEFTSYNGTSRNRIARLNDDGSLDVTFNPGIGASNTIYTTSMQPDGKIIIGGNFNDFNGTSRSRIARLNPDGSLDPLFNPGTGANNWVLTTVIQPNGKIIIGGEFTGYNNLSVRGIARIYGSDCPLLSIPIISGNTSFCIGGSTVLTSSALTGNLWSTGDTTRSITVSTAGNYSVRAVSSGCTSAASAVTTVSANSVNSSSTPRTISGFTYISSFNGKDYYSANSIQTWQEARSVCQAAGGDLAVFETEQEWLALGQIESNRSLWLGLTDEVQEGNFRWVNGAPLNFTAWHPGEPNNDSGNENYAHIINNAWNDLPNSHPLWQVSGLLEISQIQSRATSNSPVVVGSQLSFSAPTIANATYTWSGPNGFSSSLQNPTINNVSISNSGRYYVRINVSGCDRMDTLEVAVNCPGTPNTSQYAVSTFAGSRTAGFANGQGSNALFSAPIGACFDKQGNMYISDTHNNRVRKIDRFGNVTTLAGSGVPGLQNGLGVNATFSHPAGIAIDKLGNLYVSDYLNNVIRKISSTGVVSTYAGSGIAGNSNGNVIEARFFQPRDLTVDSLGNVFVVDAGNHSIRKISPTGIVTTFAGNGGSGFQNGRGTLAQFNYPTGIEYSNDGNLYVCDYGNHRIRKIDTNGNVITFAGIGIISNSNGNRLASGFYHPQDLAIDSYGNIFISDVYNNFIRKINLAGVVSTIAGNGTIGSLNGSALSSSFNYPQGIAIDKLTNTLFLTDTDNNLIRKISPVIDTIRSSICAGSSYTFGTQTLFLAGVYNRTIQNALGCDSLISLYLTVNPVLTGTASRSICQGSNYVFGGVALTTSGTYYDTLSNSNGCDSVVTLNLNVRPVSSTSISQSICQGSSYQFGGLLRTTAGVYNDTLANSLGCDSIITLNLTVNPVSASSISRTICQGSSFVLGGVEITTSGTYNDTLSNGLGCDSVVTLTLTVNPVSATAINRTICQGSSFVFGGLPRTTAGIYIDTLANSLGCDSVVTLNLTVRPVSSSSITQSICQGSTYQFGGLPRTESGIYLDTLANSLGCDSIVTLNLTVRPVSSTSIAQTICQGNSYLFGGILRTTSGVYLDTLSNSLGCDSIITLNLTVNPLPPTPIISGNNTFCVGGSTTLTSSALVGNFWSNGDTTRNISVSNPGSYSVFLISGACTSAVSIAFEVRQIDLNRPQVNVSTNNLIAGDSAILTILNPNTGSEYVWSNGAIGTRIVIRVSDTLTAQERLSGCLSESSTPIVITSNKKSIATKFQVFPNPATDKVTIKTTGTGTLEILNNLGQIIITQPATATKEINVSKLAKGIYTVRFNGVSKLLVVK